VTGAIGPNRAPRYHENEQTKIFKFKQNCF